MVAADLVRVLDAQAQLLTPRTPSLPSPKVPWTPGQRRRALSILQRRQAPPAMLQAELLSLVCHGDKCGLPSGRLATWEVLLYAYNTFSLFSHQLIELFPGNGYYK